MWQPVLDAALLVVELAALVFAVTLAVQLVQARVGAVRLRSWMGGRGLAAALKGVALGCVTPFCTFTAVPMLVGLRQAGVPAAGYVAFIVGAPVLDPVLFVALTVIAGLDAALLYGGIAVAAALGLALSADRVGIERWLVPVEAMLGTASRGRGGESDCGDPPGGTWRGLSIELPGAARRATSLLVTMAPILLVGIAIAVLIEAAVPPDVTQMLAGADPTFSVPIAAALGTPLYVSTAALVPIAAGLQNAGVGIGAIVAFTIAGAGANIPEFVILSRLARAHVIGAFVGYVVAVAVAGGLLAQALLG